MGEVLDIEFRAYASADLGDFREMVFALYYEDPEGLPITEEKIVRTADESLLRPEKVRIIMIRSGGINVGYGLLTFCWSNEYGGDVVRMDEVYVRPEWRGKRAGASFIEYVLETYKDAALFEVETTSSNEGAMRLYLDCGFEVSGNRFLVRGSQMNGSLLAEV